ncbi:MAG: hypothetical protein KC620_14685 [Myxococcales bacterium]|nr:hypothetical protein [Myxococcales bacterium]
MLHVAGAARVTGLLGLSLTLAGCFVDFPAPAAPDALPGRDAAPRDHGLASDGGFIMVDSAPPDAVPDLAPGEEGCNQLDDDGDGRIDEGLGVGEPCTRGQGNCMTAGTLRCNANARIECSAPLPGGAPERCDGVDNDCDLRIDEGFDVGQPCMEGIGVCEQTGHKICDESGEGTLCTVVGGDSRIETCNGADDDCDTLIDEGLFAEPCRIPGAVGRCAEGTRDCDHGRYGECMAPAERVETCDGTDDDCDGQVDEGFDVGIGCLGRRDACEFNSVRSCAPDGRSTICAPPEETCDGYDEDCDLMADEDAACGPDIVAECDTWLLWADVGGMTEGNRQSWGDCPMRNAAVDGDVRCVRAPTNGEFSILPLPADERWRLRPGQRIGLAFRCPFETAGDWIDSNCSIYLGLSTLDPGPQPIENWGLCPTVPASEVEPVCVSSRRDEKFNAVVLPDSGLAPADGLHLGVAFVCDDNMQPERARELQRSVDIFLAWADGRSGELGGASWGPPDTGCPTLQRDGDGPTRCVGSGGDGLFHSIPVPVFDTNDRLGIAVRSRRRAP